MPIKPENRAAYGPGWKAFSHDIRFVRAEGRCECVGQCGIDHGGRCEARHGEAHPVTGSIVVLTVAHVNHRPEERGHDQVFAGCQRCHLRYDAAHHAANARRTAEAKRRAVIEKAGQMAFQIECATGRKVAR